MKPGTTTTIVWGRGGGKSWFMRTVIYLLVAKYFGKPRYNKVTGKKVEGINGVRVVILMPTFQQFKKVHETLMMNELESDQWKFLGGVYNKSSMRVTFADGSWIQVISAEKGDNARGVRADFLCVDEADDIDIEIMEAITLPFFTEVHSLAMTLMSGTPKRSKYGLLYRGYHKWPNDPELKGKCFGFHHSCYDFPEHVSQDQLRFIKQTTTPEIFEREYMVSFSATEGLVYDIFKPDFHVREPPKNIRYHGFIIGGDWGYNDPNCQLVIGIQGSGNDTVLWVLDEWYETKKVLDDCVNNAVRFNQLYPNAYWYYDPSRPDSILTMRRKAGINIKGAENDIEDGIAAVANRMLIRNRYDVDENPIEQYSQIYVSPKCKNLLEELGKYRRKRDPRNKEVVLETPEDKYNHACDALRYAIFTHFGKVCSRIDKDESSFKQNY